MDDSLCLPGETWKEIEGFPGYEVSDMGRVRSFYKRAWRDWEQVAEPQRILKGALTPQGYRFVSLRRLGLSYTQRIHQLVLEAFVGFCPGGQECCHNDGNPLNNHLSNLRYDTHLENMHDAIEHGWIPGQVGSLSEEDVIAIRTRYANGTNRQKLAVEYQKAPGYITVICRGEAYSELGGPRTNDRRRKLTAADARRIRQDVREYGDQTIQAAKYGCSESMISLIMSGQRYPEAVDD